MNDLVVITWYAHPFMTRKEKMIGYLLWQFKVMKCHKVIRLWLGGVQHLAAYLGKMHTSFPFVGVSRYHM